METQVRTSPKEVAKQKANANAEANKKAMAEKKAKKAKKIRYLPEGMTGKELQQNRSKSNKAHKQDQGSFSYCLKRALQFDAGYVSSMAIDVNLLTPARLLRFQTEKDKARHAKQKESKDGFVRFSVWEVQALIKRYAEAINK